VALEYPPRRISEVITWVAPLFWGQFFSELTVSVTPNTRASSWWRSPAKNIAVGGNPDSQHLIGTAIDLVVPENEKRQVIADLTRFGWVVVDEGDHLHAQAWPAGLARSIGLLDYLGL